MRGEVHILVHCPIDTLQWGSTHSAMRQKIFLQAGRRMCVKYLGQVECYVVLWL